MTLTAKKISIHALREERDRFVRSILAGSKVFQSTRSARSATISIVSSDRAARLFQSTRSARSATFMRHSVEILFPISIHALREERDT